MSIILEFTIAAENFRLGRVLSGSGALEFEFERIVTTGHALMPVIWATGDAHETFEATVRDDPAVTELLALDSLDTGALYRVEWNESPTDRRNVRSSGVPPHRGSGRKRPRCGRFRV